MDLLIQSRGAKQALQSLAGGLGSSSVAKINQKMCLTIADGTMDAGDVRLLEYHL